MDDNTSIQFRLRLAQINGININEEQIDEAFLNRGAKEYPAKKYPIPSKVSKRLSSPIGDSTHHIPNFVAPTDSTGDHLVHHLGGIYNYTGRDDKSNRHEFDSGVARGSGSTKILINRQGHITNVNEEQIAEADHHILARVSKDDGKMTQKSVIVTTKNRDAAMVRAERHFRDKGMKVHALKYVRQSDSAPYLPGSSNVREENQMKEEQIDEVKRSADYLHSTATEDQRAPTLKTYHTAMAKYSNLPPRAAHIKALNDTIDKHGVKNANQHVTKHFYSQMQKHLSDED